MKKKYSFVSEITISVNLELEAESLAEAITEAQESPVMSLCHQCAGGHDGEWSTSGELDGEPNLLNEVLVDGEPLSDRAKQEARKLWKAGVR